MVELTSSQAEVLFDSLEALAEGNPWFRSSDWDSRTAAGLMVVGLKARIEGVIRSNSSNSHLRSLLIEGLKGAELAGEFCDVLEAVVLSSNHYYRERDNAAEALLPYRDRGWYRATIQSLIETPSEDAGRLARKLVELIEGDVPDAMLVAVLFAELGLLVDQYPRAEKRRVHTIRDCSPSAPMAQI